MTTEQKQAKYLQACRILDAFNKKHNICNIHRNEAGEVMCTQRLRADSPAQFKVDTLCCTGCTHLAENGCTVKSIGCKMHYCYFGVTLLELNLVTEESGIDEKHIQLQQKIREYFKRHDIPGYRYRMSMGDNFKTHTGLVAVPVAAERDFDHVRGVFKEDVKFIEP